jgi:GAF domain-containing protein
LRTADLTEALEQQTATSDVLGVISSSPGDLEPVFQTILQNATRICEAKFGTFYFREGETFRTVTMHGAPPEYAEFHRRRGPFQPPPGSQLDKVTRTKQWSQSADYDAEATPGSAATLAGARSRICVPMLKGDVLIGAIAIYRQEVRPFTDRQIELVQNFAAQAVIAIENARLLNELRQRTADLTESTTDLTEALERQTATSEVLQVISSSPGELEPVFDTMLANATRLCEATHGNIWRFDGKQLHAVAVRGDAGFVEWLRQHNPVPPIPGSAAQRIVRGERIVHVTDRREEDAYRNTQMFRELVDKSGVRASLSVALHKDEKLLGMINVYRQEVRPFSDKQIALVQNFAAQAVIAIENARLLNELRQRTTELTERTNDLTEALEQQIATADVLKVISRSTFDLPTVLDTLTESAARLCVADKGIILLRAGDVYRVVANYGFSPEALRYAAEHPLQPDRGSATGRAALERRAIHIRDVLADPEYRAGGYQQAFGYRTALGVPLLRQGSTIGVFFLSRDEVNPFTQKQIELVATFADQAMIAIENARLFDAEQQRTRELTESLEQQTATSKVLDVISRSVFDLHAVFEAVAESSVRLCGADRAFIYRFDTELLRMVIAYNTSREFKEFVEQNPLRPSRHSCAARTALERRTIHIPDVLTDPEYTFGAKAFDKIRTVLGVPILKSDDLLGVIVIYHQEVRPFTDKQIALVEIFADQAAIAIENVRLLDALRQRTDELGRSVGELRALGEVSQAVNSTLDLETVLSTIVAKAVQLSGTDAGAIYVFDDLQREFRLRATYGMDQELIDALTHADMGVNEPNIALILAKRGPIQVADLNEEAPSDLNEITLRAGYRARLVAPLIRAEDVIGLLVVRRKAPGTFPQSTVDLIKTFAAQSAVAIENARLFHNVEASLHDLRTAQDRLIQTEKLASLGQLTAGIAHEIKNPLNFVNNFSAVSIELIDELREALGGAHLDSKLRAEISEIADTLQGNLDKVVQHGKRADAIVKNMLLHSRQGSGEHRPVDINALVEESLNLAYHGARAEKQGFNITLERLFDPATGEVDLFPQEITRVLLNLISNGFYAATKRKAETNGGDYEPTLATATKDLGDSVEIRIRDNGTGIPPEVKEKLFSPFFTTKPAGEGTGLGLSISHDIIVKQHGGSIEVDTRPGEFAEFRIVLPRRAAIVPKSGE